MPPRIFCCLLFFSFAGFCDGQQTGSVLNLSSGKPVSALLTPEHTAQLRVDVAASEAKEVVLDMAAPDMVYRVNLESGAELLSGRSQTSGWIVLALPPQAVSQEIQIQVGITTRPEGLSGMRVGAQAFPLAKRDWLAEISAAKLFNAASPLHRHLRGKELQRAIQQFQLAAGIWEQIGNTRNEAMALGGKAESEIELSRFSDAGLTLKHALGLAADDSYLRGWLLHLAARVLFDQYQGKQAQPYAAEEQHLGSLTGDQALIAQAGSDLAGVSFWLRDGKAEALANEAHKDAVAAGVPETLAAERRWMNWIQETNEQMVEGAETLSEAQNYFQLAGDPRNALEVTLEIAVAGSLNGAFYSALTAFAKLEPLFRDSGSALEYGDLLVNIGLQYQLLNNLKLADMYFRRGDEAYASAHILVRQMYSHQYLCDTELRAGKAADAANDCRLALSLAHRFGDDAFVGQSLYYLASSENSTGRLTQALAHSKDAVAAADRNEDLRFQAKEHVQLGELLEKQGKRQEALGNYVKARSESRQIADPAILMEAQFDTARWYARSRKFKEASEELDSVLRTLETTRQSVSNGMLQASYFAAERKCYELAIELHMQRFQEALVDEDNADALAMSERSRARELLDTLNKSNSSNERRTGEAKAQQIRTKLAVDLAFDRRLKLLIEGASRRDLDASSAQLTKALGDFDRTEDESKAAPASAVRLAAPMTAVEIEGASSNSKTTFLEYAFGSEHSYLWVIRAGELKSYVLKSREQLETMVRQWRALATDPNREQANNRARFQRLSARLSCELFPLDVGTTSADMVIVPDGGLAMLPFAALPENGCSGKPGEPLVVKHQITLTPSLSAFFSHKARPDRSHIHGELAVVADPVFNLVDSRAMASSHRQTKESTTPISLQAAGAELPRLIGTGLEAASIRSTVGQAVGYNQVFLAQGFEANLSTVLSPKMREYRVWHLATHGIYDESMPEFSGLVFSLLEADGSHRFGLLKAQDIAQLDIPAELVVLSACDSAEGENVNGEGVMGLSYAFLHAGAQQVISTLWSVDDAKSRELMVEFYRKFIHNGRNAAEALRESQLAMMRQKPKASPFYWAGYELNSVGR